MHLDAGLGVGGVARANAALATVRDLSGREGFFPFAPCVAEGFPFGVATAGAGGGSFTGRVTHIVAEGFPFGVATAGAGGWLFSVWE